jgi:hypothetical protein
MSVSKLLTQEDLELRFIDSINTAVALNEEFEGFVVDVKAFQRITNEGDVRTWARAYLWDRRTETVGDIIWDAHESHDIIMRNQLENLRGLMRKLL